MERTILFRKSVTELPCGIAKRFRHGPVRETRHCDIRDPSFHVYPIVQLTRLDTYPIVQVPRCFFYDSMQFNESPLRTLQTLSCDVPIVERSRHLLWHRGLKAWRRPNASL